MNLSFQKILFLTFIFLIFLSSCSPENVDNTASKKVLAPDSATKTKQKPSKEPNTSEFEMKKMVYIIVDALRADRLGSYGFRKDITPTMDKIASQGILFEKVHSASPWTAPSFGTLFTGVSPGVHGAGQMLGKNSKQGESIMGVTVGGIRADLPTMAQLLPDEMKKGAILNNSFLTESSGYAKGFDTYDLKIARLTNYRTADQVTDLAIKWLEENKDDSFFLLIHYFDPHMQYGPPPVYAKMFTDKKPPRISYPFTDHLGARTGSLNLSDEEKNYISGLYQGEVRFVDDEIGRLTKYMKTQKLLDNTWIMLLSDHGEEHFEHGSFDHGHRYEEEVVRVPWIIRGPKGKFYPGKRIPYNVSHIDILPTLLDLARIPSPAHFEGRSVLPMINEEKKDRLSYMEFNLFSGQQCALFDGRFKVIHDIRRGTSFMYDLLEDPKEQKKIKENNQNLEKILALLHETRKEIELAGSKGTKTQSVLSSETEEALRSLGYIE